MEDSLNTQIHDSKRARRNRDKGRSIWVNLLLLVVSLGLWSGIVYYGYTNAKAYIDTSISNVEQKNMMEVQQLTEEIKIVNSEIIRLRDEVRDLKDEIRDADSTLTDSNDIQENIDKRLKYLDDKLMKLQESLKILEGAPNVQN